MSKQQIVIIKVGTNVLTDSVGLIDLGAIKSLVNQIADLVNNGKKVVLVSSGAIGAGKTLKKVLKTKDIVVQRQVWAALGQAKLMNIYTKLFAKYELSIAQVLATKMDFSDRNHYLNIRQCLTALLAENTIPIVNENDVVSISELMFTDNDELASLIATMLNAEKLIILTSVDGLFTGDPSSPTSQLIKQVDSDDAEIMQYIQPIKSSFGRGGMITKCRMALKSAAMGIDVYLANGKNSDAIVNICAGINVGTRFIPKRTKSALKKWIGFSDSFTRGYIVIDEGLEQALKANTSITSILLVGVKGVEGQFMKNDLIAIVNSEGSQLGVGLTQYTTEEVIALLGKSGGRELIHYDYLYLN